MEILDIITMAVALLPTVVIMFIVLFNSDSRKKPFRKIASVFGVSVLSVIPAMIAELIGEVILALILMLATEILGVTDFDPETGSTAFVMLYQTLQFFLVVGVSEELCKYFTFKWIIFHDREFDNTYDGVIYGAASALGFATLENLMYVFLVSDSSLETAVMRAVLSVPMHAITGIVMGYCFGISKYHKYNYPNVTSHPENKALLFSIILHGSYDAWVTVPAVFEDMNEVLFYGILAALMIFIYITLGRTIHKAKKESHRIYNAYYYNELDGRLQDMIGGKTSDKKRFFGFPLPMFRGGYYPPQPPPPQFMQGVPQYTQQPFVQGVPQYVPPQFNYAPPPYPQQGQPAPQNFQDPRNFQGQQNFQRPVQNPVPPVYPQNNNYAPYPQSQAAAPYPQNQGATAYRQSGAAPTVMQPAAPPAPRVRRFCPNCGEEAGENNKFCRICGSAIPDVRSVDRNFS